MGNKGEFTSRERKKNNNFEKNGKYSSKHIRIQLDNKDKYDKHKTSITTENNELQKKHLNK
jgi:hypothetical protein